MSVNLKWIETVLLLIVAIRINAQTPAPVKKDEMTVWYPNQALDVWSGKKSMINVITNDFFGVLNGVALNPQAEWRPQTKFDADRINKIVGGGVNDRESVKIVELDDEDEYDEDYEDDETYGYDDKDESKRKSHNAKYGSY
ncbi:uncharacterized protein isoform X1 [Choristoneura fumiferana]|uniref:uncharacterized protein isoform X1 n=1 Tax=Choristoneura fumiferana TaxID=7141 RepID=UPI003D154854